MEPVSCSFTGPLGLPSINGIEFGGDVNPPEHRRDPDGGLGMTLRWRGMTDDEREREYSPSSCLTDGDYGPFIEEYRRASREAWSRLDETAGTRTSVVRYGDSESQTIDVALAVETVAQTPLVAFFHGGYWQELSKSDSRFGAWDCVQRGWAFAAIDYTLAPRADLSEIVDECRRAIGALHREAASLGFDPARVFVAGSSAGAHLAAMVAADPPEPAHRIRGAVLVSGIFELEPLIGTSINDALRLDAVTAAQNSPLRADLEGFPPTVLAHGANETAEFKAQSQAFASRLEAAGTAVTKLEVPGRNHFDVILDLARPGTTLGDTVAELIETRGGADADL